MTDAAEHWARVWAGKSPTEVSWFEAEPQASLQMIDELGLAPDAPILDVGGGASRLAGELLARGYSDVTVADISPEALEKAKEALGTRSNGISWVAADVRSHAFGREFALWHDRAVFHFMTDRSDRERYLRTLRSSLAPGGHVIVATFGPDGPQRCSGLPVTRYGPEELADAFAPVAGPVSSRLVDHSTPGGAAQQFLYARLEAG
jgi:SAM-dependent methyltransferase